MTGAHLLNRINLFLKRNIRLLFLEAYTTPQPRRSTSQPTVTKKQSYTQQALNNDDYKKAMSHIHSMPIATILNENMHIRRDLFPQHYHQHQPQHTISDTVQMQISLIYTRNNLTIYAPTKI